MRRAVRATHVCAERPLVPPPWFPRELEVGTHSEHSLVVRDRVGDAQIESNLFVSVEGVRGTVCRRRRASCSECHLT